VIIDADDPVVPKGAPFGAVGLEHVFAEKRTYEEMIIARQSGQKYAGIEWGLLHQQLASYGRIVTTYWNLLFPRSWESDWNMLAGEWEGRLANLAFDLQAYKRKQEQKMMRFTGEFWFSINSFDENIVGVR